MSHMSYMSQGTYKTKMTLPSSRVEIILYRWHVWHVWHMVLYRWHYYNLCNLSSLQERLKDSYCIWFLQSLFIYYLVLCNVCSISPYKTICPKCPPAQNDTLFIKDTNIQSRIYRTLGHIGHMVLYRRLILVYNMYAGIIAISHAAV